MKAVPAVSAIVPAYNADQFIAEAIQSTLTQTVPPVEVIVVDDGSTDRTAAVLGTFGRQIKVIEQKNRGPAAARNLGAAAASGDWLAFLDADDTWLPDKLARQLDVAAAGQVALVYTDRFNIGHRGSLPEVQSHLKPADGQLYAGDVFADLLLLGNHITASSVLLRSDVFRSLNGFSEEPALAAAEDWDLWIRVAERHPVGVCREPLVRYRCHEGSLSTDPRRVRFARARTVERALALDRGRALPLPVRRRIRAATSSANASEAARHGMNGLAFGDYVRAIGWWPFSVDIHLDLLRFLAGRHDGTVRSPSARTSS